MIPLRPAYPVLGREADAVPRRPPHAPKKRKRTQPFRGLVNYAAVLCFLFEEREAVYFALRAMFARYWCRLNAVRSGPGMLLRLLKLFEVRSPGTRG